MKKFVLTLLVLACTNIYATGNNHNNGNNDNSDSFSISSQSDSKATSNVVANSDSKSNASATGNNVIVKPVGGNGYGGSGGSGGSGGAGGNATGGNATGGNATGGNATGGNATGGTSLATGGTSISGSLSQGGNSSSNSTGGTSNSSSTGGNSSATSGNSSAKGGDSAATGGKVDSNIASYINVGCTENCGANGTDKQIAEDRIAADKEIAAGNNKAQVDAANARIKNTPSMFSPPLVSSNDTCMGSTSGSVAAPGLGIGFGTAWVDENCKMLKNSQALWNMGYRAASIALMCNDDKVKQALEITGYICPIKETKNTNVVVSKPYEQ